jgi:hypothetical protein
MRTTEGLTLVYIDSSNVSRPLTEDGTENEDAALVVIDVELEVVIVVEDELVV